MDDVYGDSYSSLVTVKNWFNEFQSCRKSGFDDVHGHGVRKRQPRRISWWKFTSRSPIEGALVHSGQQAQLWDHIPAVFNAVDQTCTSIVRHQKPRKSWNTGLQPANLLRIRGKLCCWPERWWQSFSGIHTAWSTYIGYLEKGKTAKGPYHAELLCRFDTKLQKKRPHLAKKKLIFHHYKTAAQTSPVATEKLVELWYELLCTPPYSPVKWKSLFCFWCRDKKKTISKWFSGILQSW